MTLGSLAERLHQEPASRAEEIPFTGLGKENEMDLVTDS